MIWKNKEFIYKYNIDTEKEKEILISLTEYDFCYSTRNRNKGYEHEILYVFTKKFTTVTFEGKTSLDMYIKMNMIESKAGEFLIVISFHERNYPMDRLFEEE